MDKRVFVRKMFNDVGFASNIRLRQNEKRCCIFRAQPQQKASFASVDKRGFLAGVVGIEPTIWESEAHVLPLHYTPTTFRL